MNPHDIQIAGALVSGAAAGYIIAQIEPMVIWALQQIRKARHRTST